MSTIILIRGNSGSGKTSVAKELHELLGEGNLLISQDYVRRSMLSVKDEPMNLAIGLIEVQIEYGIKNCKYTIVEGIFGEAKYGDMLRNVIEKADFVYAYYYNLSFEETLKRHRTKKGASFSEDKMRNWFLEYDVLGIQDEKVIFENVTKKEMVNQILNDLNRL